MTRSLIHGLMILEELEGRKLTANISAPASFIHVAVSPPVQVAEPTPEPWRSASTSTPVSVVYVGVSPFVRVTDPSPQPWQLNPNPEDPGEPHGPGTPVIRYEVQARP
jgi:hypothetical protein